MSNYKKPAILCRLEQTSECSRGVLMIDGRFICMTLERPWLDNQPNISCIPPGHYTCRRVRSPRFGDTFEICDVPGRSHILFHAGNRPEDTLGCVLTGRTLPPLTAEIHQSRKGLATFMDVLEGIDTFPLEVV